MPGLVCTDDLVLCGESKEDLRAMVEWFVEVCRKRAMKINASKSKEMVLRREWSVCFGQIRYRWSRM